MLNNLRKLFILSSMLLIVACSTDDDGDQNQDQGNNQTAQQVTNIAQSGNWVVSSFVDSGTDETNDFAGYTFDFQNDGTLVATNGTQTLTGTWSVTHSSGNSSGDDDDDDDDNDFNIFFPVDESNDFEDLNDDWDIVSATDSRIELLDVSGGNGGTDRLIFTKN